MQTGAQSFAFCCAILAASALGLVTASDEGQLFWNAIGLIKRVRDARRGSPAHEADGPVESERAARLLRDPDFLYETFYRDEDKGRAAGQTDDRLAGAATGSRLTSGASFVASLHGNLRRAFDVLEIEHRLRRLRQIAAPIDDGRAADGPEAGGAEADNMAERISERDGPCSDGTDDGTGDGCSIQRTKRQAYDEDEFERQEFDEDLEPYVPYLGFIFYSFPIFSFTLPFGGQLKLFGYDFI